jgi:hypothetical protein
MRAHAASARARGARETNPPAFTTIIIRAGVLLRFCVIIIYCALN